MDNVVISRQFNKQVKELDAISEKPTLQALAYALRNRDTWPPGFTWDYRSADHCAIGLTGRLWPDSIRSYRGRSGYGSPCLAEIQNAFALPLLVAFVIFINGYCLGNYSKSPTPEHVADMIDQYLKQGEISFMFGRIGF